TGQSTLDGLIRATNLLLAGRTFVVCGYVRCGRGLASRAHGMGAHVVVTDADPTRALEELMAGSRVIPLGEAVTPPDVLLTVTESIDKEVARLKLASLGVRIDELTEEQRRYLASWDTGT